MRKVVGGNGPGTPDGLAPYAMGAFDFFTEDIGTMLSADATEEERLAATLFTFFKPAKMYDTAHDALKTGEKVNDAGKGTGKASQKVSGVNSNVIEELKGPVIDGKRVGSGKKVDEVKPVWGRDEKGKPFIDKEFPHVSKEHGFSDVVDNYSRFAEKFPLVGGDNVKRELYQITGSNNGKKGVFEWIIEQSGDMSHRRFIENGVITGKPNQILKK